MHERTTPKRLPLSRLKGHMTTITRALGSRDEERCPLCSELTSNALVSRWLLRLLISPICCIFPQFQWITYDVYHPLDHPSLFIVQESLGVNCHLEFSTSLYDDSFMFHAG